MNSPPTEELYQELQTAYAHFNSHLFSGQLPDCIITLQRQKKIQSYYSPGRFTDRRSGLKVGEIALNPSYFAVQSIRDTMQCLVHEQSHLWQTYYGTPGRGRYHNEEWAAMLEKIGLMPSDTGRPGGKRTGDRMSDYVIEGGAFEVAFKALMTKDFMLSWLDRFPVSRQHLAETLHQLPEETQLAVTEEEAEKLSIQIVDEEPEKVATPRYICPLCQIKVWGKTGLAILCGKCKVDMQSKPAERKK